MLQENTHAEVWSNHSVLGFEITLRHGCFPVNLLHIFKIHFPKNISGGLLLYNCVRLKNISSKYLWLSKNTSKKRPLVFPYSFEISDETHVKLLKYFKNKNISESGAQLLIKSVIIISGLIFTCCFCLRGKAYKSSDSLGKPTSSKTNSSCTIFTTFSEFFDW